MKSRLQVIGHAFRRALAAHLAGQHGRARYEITRAVIRTTHPTPRKDTAA